MAPNLTVTEEYTPRGREETIAGLKTYVTGPRDAKVGVVDVYDVLGISNPTMQGADLLAAALNAVVVVPDVLKGTYAQREWFPLDTEEKRNTFFGYLRGYAFPKNHLETFQQAMDEYKRVFPTVEKWGSFGLCWGGKVVALTSKASTPFAASAQVHPGMLDPADAEDITIPHIVLASQDEPADMVAGFKSVIESNGIGGFVETYPMFHGWMGSNARLGNEEGRREYTRGYTQLVEFFQTYLLETVPCESVESAVL